MIATIALCGVAVVFCFLYLSHRDLDARVRQDVSLAREHLGMHFSTEREWLKIQSQLIANQEHVANLIRDREYGILNVVIDKYSKDLNADGVIITDGNDMPIVVSGPLAGDNLTDWGCKGVSVVGDRLVLSENMPMRFGLTESVWTYVVVDDEVIQEMAKVMNIDMIITQNGRVLGRSSSDLIAGDNYRNEPTMKNYADVRYMTMSAKCPETLEADNIELVILRNYDTSTELYKQVNAGLIGLLVAILIAALGFAARFASQISRPIDDLISAAYDVSEGRWPEALPVTRDDEIGLLQAVFNRMTSSIQTTQSNLLSLMDLDPLTMVKNHRSFREDLDAFVSDAIENKVKLSILLIDIDRFSTYNEQHGRVAGDRVLKFVADCLTEECESAVVGRYGGEEFAVLLRATGLDEAVEVGQRLKSWITSRAAEEGIGITVSIGCAELHGENPTSEGLLLSCELALGRAKQTGRDQVCRFDYIPGFEHEADPHILRQYLRDASYASIEALAAAVDAKDPYTQGHSHRVAKLAADFARYCGMGDAEADLIYRTATLHDVGKIGVPDTILQKPGPLTPEERSVMETHTVLGELIVGKVPQLSETLPGVRHHHERWDGKGYPDGLAGEHIPWVARLLAIADTFDAMISDRQYRKGLSFDQAIQEIKDHAGTQFDPELAQRFVQMMLDEKAQHKAA